VVTTGLSLIFFSPDFRIIADCKESRLKILITGTGGLIGSYLLRKVASKHQVYALSRSKPKNGRNFFHLPIDLSSEWKTEALPGKVDCVISLAQSEHFRDFPEYAEEIFRVNTLSTVRLLDYAVKAGAKSFVLASSGGIYGSGNNKFYEDDKIFLREDLGFYLGTKLCSEIVAESYSALLHVIVLRFFFVYGPHQRKTMLIPRLIEKVKNREPIILQGKEGIRINPIYVSDAVEAIMGSLSLHKSCKINIGGPEQLSLRTIGDTIGTALHKKPCYTYLDEEPKHLVCDITNMSKVLCAPKVKFTEGLRRMLKAEKAFEKTGMD